MKKSFIYSLLILIALAGCATNSGGRKQQSLAFDRVAPLDLGVSDVQAVIQYNASADPRDISARFATPPVIALQRYAAKRLRANGTGNSLMFVIENASVHEEPVESDSKVAQWLTLGRSNRYTINVKLSLYTVARDGSESPHAHFNFEKARNIPDNLSVAAREQEQNHLLEILIGDIDKGVTDVLQNRMSLVRGMSPGIGIEPSFSGTMRPIQTEQLPPG
jgi:hypothetical protein